MAKKNRKGKNKAAKTTPIRREIKGLTLFAMVLIAGISLLSFGRSNASTNALGYLGYLIGTTLHATFGLSSYFLLLFAGWLGWRMMFNKTINHPVIKTLYVAILILSTSMLLSLIEDQFPTVAQTMGATFYPALWHNGIRYHLGGAPFFFIYRDIPTLNLFHMVNVIGIGFIFGTAFIISLSYLVKLSPTMLLQRTFALLRTMQAQHQAHRQKIAKEHEPAFAAAVRQETKDSLPEQKEQESDFLRFVKLRIPGTVQSPSEQGAPAGQELLAIRPEANPKTRPSLSRKSQGEEIDPPSQVPFKQDITKQEVQREEPTTTERKSTRTLTTKKEEAIAAQRIYNGDFTGYQLPPANILSIAKKIDQSLLKKDLKKQAEVLEETLASFGIEAKVGQINCGPTITSFEVHPAIGVKVQKIKTLENDIALNMEARSIRIIAPIPGKAAVGIEVPNPQPQEVGFKDMLLEYLKGPKKFHIPVLLGKAANGDYVMNDLTKMPHCIIAGATGSGKSVCINTIVMTILMTARPDEIKLVMVDPKKVELTPYTRLPHMLAPVITEPQGACSALNWLVKEMESRYELFKLIGTRNIEAYNTRTINPELENTLEREVPPKLPYIVGIIDELADLMMAASNDIETPIARIAQMARAVGIHLILATQRPSREVITGLIKANFPTRISFKVASRVNSQIVLDEIGAESLLGNGDLLFLPPGTSHLMRAQGAFIRDEDINAVVKFICDQAPPNYVIQSFDRMSFSDSNTEEEESEDDLYKAAVDVVLGTGNASTTFLQRKLKIGYARAASLIDRMETKGLVGPAEGSKPRKILVARRAVAEQNGAMGDLDEE